MEALRNQTRVAKIPAGLPENTPCANKTGELDHVQNDVAIITSPACEYILCVMSQNVNFSPGTENVRQISETVYRYLNALLAAG